MALNLASPGIVVKEIDLTVGQVTPVTGGVGAIVAPFAKGPTDVPTFVANENDLLKIFGEPYNTDKHYEHWLVASSYLAYGGALQVVRADDSDLKNAFVGSASSIKIKSKTDYNNLGYDLNTINGVIFASQNPGSWANGIKVAIIDAKADQIISVASTAGLFVGYGVTQPLTGAVASIGSTSNASGFLKGIITEVGNSTISVKVLSQVSTANTSSTVDYQPFGTYAFNTTSNIVIYNNGGTGIATLSPSNVLDWYDQQTISLSNSSINWSNVAPRPATSAYAAARNSRFDQLHVVVIDDQGKITGNAGTILEKHLGLSKATDAEFSVGSPSYWRSYISNASSFIFGGGAPSGLTASGFVNNSYSVVTNIGWDQDASNITFGTFGASTYTLNGGLDYNGQAGITTSGSLTASLGYLSSGYQKFINDEQTQVNFVLMGSGNYDKATTQAIAQQCIAVAEERKDAVAFISPNRQSFLIDTSTGSATVYPDTTITENVISFYSSIPSTSYGVFDSGYKYMYDRFSNTFRWVPLNGDIAGLCARNDVNNFPWNSPAGTQRGAILNAVKLAYNPSKAQRDRLYTNRINPVIFSPGAGIILFGDKTGLGYSSAFDRINVRRLFIYLEKAISGAAKDQLFEFNDEITRTNFVNIVEPFLRDVQAKRGIFDYVVVCDETNNTAAVIDANEFVADIYIKPARSINFIGLTFVATRTGVSFEEVIGQF